MSQDEEPKSFTVKDRRRFDASGNKREDADLDERERQQAQQPQKRPAAAQQQPPRAAQQPQRPQPPPQPQRPPQPQQPRRPAAMEEDDEMEASMEGEPGPLGFSEFILSIATNAVMHMGGEPKDGRIPGHVNLPLAAQHIDIIAMLAQKTRGNLTRDEAELIEALLYDLRMKYVSVAQAQQRGR
jgi:hypothetical protein